MGSSGPASGRGPGGRRYEIADHGRKDPRGRRDGRAGVRSASGQAAVHHRSALPPDLCRRVSWPAGRAAESDGAALPDGEARRDGGMKRCADAPAGAAGTHRRARRAHREPATMAQGHPTDATGHKGRYVADAGDPAGHA